MPDDFLLPLPGVEKGAPPRPCTLLAFASLGKSFYGEAQAGFEIASVRNGTRFVSLTTALGLAVGGQPVTLTLACDVSGLAAGARTILVNAEGRLKWLGTPQDQWLDGRRNNGTAFKAPPLIPLTDQRVTAVASDEEPTRATESV